MKKYNSAVNPFVLIFIVILFVGLLSFMIVPGELVDGVYTEVPRNKVNFNSVFNIFRAIPLGIKDSANIIILILSVGGVLGIYKKTGAVNAGVNLLVRHSNKKSNHLLLALIVLVFSFLGGFLGWIEVLIPFCPLVVAVVLALGYDAVVAVAVVIVGSMAGFMVGPMNLYTVAICNGILQQLGYLAKDGSVFTGFSFRLVLWFVVTGISITYILLYAKKVRQDPEKSLAHGMDTSDLVATATEPVPFMPRHCAVLLSILAAMALTFIGMQGGIGGRKWSIDDISAVFLVSGFVSGIICRLRAQEIVDAFLDGVKGAVTGALIVGFARAVFWIADTAKINATVIYYAVRLLSDLSPLGTAFGIVLLVSLINGLIPSGSGKAMLLGPIIFPIAAELGLTGQTAVLAYQFGDGITNMFWFSYGTLMIFLNYGKVSIQKWWKFFCPLMFVFFAISFVSLTIALHLGL